MVCKRLIITIVNIFFPPLAVLLLTGPRKDFLINCVLFLCAVIPAHIHGFYIAIVYFHRKTKVRKGLDPGGHKTCIYSDKVLNGGASRSKVERLRLEQQMLSEKKEMVASGSVSGTR